MIVVRPIAREPDPCVIRHAQMFLKYEASARLPRAAAWRSWIVARALHPQVAREVLDLALSTPPLGAVADRVTTAFELRDVVVRWGLVAR